ncbi:MAG: 50S ribosomal protein L32e [Nanohaloarchaea archaeon]|nr:50S ribosomal protein L32e [Candidatus Nanohaloarchaea archaeon]
MLNGVIMVKRLLEVRKVIKSKKPSFIRQDSYRYLKLGTAWRGRKGRHNKFRLHRRGHTNPTPSYGSPVKVRGFHACGKKEVMVHNVSDLDSVNKDDEVARIAGTVGLKKRMDIVNVAKTSNIRILNPGVVTLVAIKADLKKKKSDKKAQPTVKKDNVNKDENKDNKK